MDSIVRERLAGALEACPSGRVNRLVPLVRAGACWGTLADALEGSALDPADRNALRDTLVRTGDRHALLVFASVYGAASLAPVLADLPVLLQRWLVAEGFGDGDLHPAARELREAAPEKQARERDIVRSAMASLRGMRWSAG